MALLTPSSRVVVELKVGRELPKESLSERVYGVLGYEIKCRYVRSARSRTPHAAILRPESLGRLDSAVLKDGRSRWILQIAFVYFWVVH